MNRRELRAARRRDLDGSGPSRLETPAARFPGASGSFALLGEVLLTGMLIAVVALPVVTLPAGLAAGVRHLGRYLRAEDSRLSLFWRDVRAGILGGIGVGAATLVLVLILLADLLLASSGAIPGGPVIMAVGWLGLAAVAVALCLAAGAWRPRLGWAGAVRRVPRQLSRDPAGALYLAAAVGVTAVVTWQLVPLLVPALGCVALAIVAVPRRARRR
ncbi:hypothetical protein [Naasia sp. SYSU D00948]|uniref:hypothetical protein n=1 Tax=Naasia sp. SYSU D00948 TaxID=2817379 RepID=UPI001B30389A|nr:hypothetical protein [Naasia sp. SYSU D00948]